MTWYEEVLRFMCFWDSSVSKESVDRKYNELVKEEAIRRGECPIEFAKKLNKK